MNIFERLFSNEKRNTELMDKILAYLKLITAKLDNNDYSKYISTSLAIEAKERLKLLQASLTNNNSIKASSLKLAYDNLAYSSKDLMATINIGVDNTFRQALDEYIKDLEVLINLNKGTRTIKLRAEISNKSSIALAKKKELINSLIESLRIKEAKANRDFEGAKSRLKKLKIKYINEYDPNKCNSILKNINSLESVIAMLELKTTLIHRCINKLSMIIYYIREALSNKLSDEYLELVYKTISINEIESKLNNLTSLLPLLKDINSNLRRILNI